MSPPHGARLSRFPAHVACLLLLCSCRVDADDLQREASLPRLELADPLPAFIPAESAPLYQQLYAGEVGEQAHARGQRLRIMAWLGQMQLQPAQAEALLRLRFRVDLLAEEERRERQARDGAELAALAPLYDELALALARGSPTEEELKTWASRIEAAREEAAAGADLHQSRVERAGTLLELVGAWRRSLSPEQRQKVPLCRFFLGRQAAPLVQPGGYGDLVGMSWDGGDWSMVGRTGRPGGQGQMDLGGLWSMEVLRAPPQEYLIDRQAEALLVLALLEPALEPTLREWMGLQGG